MALSVAGVGSVKMHGWQASRSRSRTKPCRVPWTLHCGCM
jgi:hypothetical protein